MNSTTRMQSQLLLIKRLQSNRCKKNLARHEKKLETLIINKRVQDDINNNPNSIITNLSNVELH